MPDVKHDSVSQAQATLKAAGFQVSVQTDNNSTAAPNTVVKQDPNAGTRPRSAARSRSSSRPAGTSCRM